MSKLFMFIIFSFPFFVSANDCEVKGYTIGFFNGVATNEQTAREGLAKIEATINIHQYKGETVDYRLFYNDSKVDDGMFDVLGDFAEVFDQRTQELEQKQFEYWEAFWEIVNERQTGSIMNRLVSIFSELRDLVTNQLSVILNSTIKSFLQTLSSLLGTTPHTEMVRMQHSLINDDLSWKGRKLIYIAHSQGNLWVNESYHNILNQDGYDSSNVKVIHIAPASPMINGDYILSTKDIVINGLNLTGIGSVPKPNFTAIESGGDRLGHGLSEVYLSDKTSIDMLNKAVYKAFLDLKKPEVEDYLLDVAFQYSESFINSYHPPLVQSFSNVAVNEELFESGGFILGTRQGEQGEIIYPEYMRSPFRHSSPIKFEVDNKERQHQRLIVSQCLGILQDELFVFGSHSRPVWTIENHLTGWKFYKIPYNIEQRITVRDRYGKELNSSSWSFDKYRYDYFWYIGSFIGFKIIENYEESERSFLNEQNLNGQGKLEFVGFVDEVFPPNPV
ncbi:hypothetical protein P0F27_002931 [Vibrio metschnikovii]|nr:hypothetical protein [Vibrio metschnikovii]EKO3725733.1 hypothetical protein [Vibrio metschnikovii]